MKKLFFILLSFGCQADHPPPFPLQPRITWSAPDFQRMQGANFLKSGNARSVLRTSQPRPILESALFVTRPRWTRHLCRLWRTIPSYFLVGGVNQPFIGRVLKNPCCPLCSQTGSANSASSIASSLFFFLSPLSPAFLIQIPLFLLFQDGICRLNPS